MITKIEMCGVRRQLAHTTKRQLAVRDELLEGDIEEAIEGIEELIEALSRSNRRELNSQLVRLMMHIVKWKSLPAKRSRSWLASISNSAY